MKNKAKGTTPSYMKTYDMDLVIKTGSTEGETETQINRKEQRTQK